MIKGVIDLTVKRIAIHDSKNTIIIDNEDLIYCKAESNYTKIFLKDRSYLISKSLNYFESSLPKALFIRCHKSYIINVNYIMIVKNQNKIVLKNNIIIPLSRRRKSKFFLSLPQSCICM